MSNCFVLALVLSCFQFHLGWSMVCQKTGTQADWWCAVTGGAQASAVTSAIAADSCFCAMSKQGMTQQDAFNNCAAAGGFLTDIQNLAENALVGTFLQALQTSGEMPTSSCGTNGVLYDGKCYVYHATLKKSWNDAESYCQTTYGGHLPSIHNLTVQRFLFNNLSNNCDGCSIYGFWAGANNYGNPKSWLWSDNSTMDFTPQITLYKGWKPQPEDPVNQNCMTICRPDGGWGDWHCEYESPFPCVYPSAIYPAWISLQKSMTGLHWNLGNNCPVYPIPYQNVTSATATNTAGVFTSSMTWTMVPPTTKLNMAVCRMDRQICKRGSCTGNCATCTATNSNTCFQCS